MFCYRQLVETINRGAAFLLECESYHTWQREKKKKSTLITQRSTLTSLVILRLTECSAGLECRSPDAARRHSSPEDIHMGAQLQIFLRNVCDQCGRFTWGDVVIEYILAPHHTAAETCRDWKEGFLGSLRGEELLGVEFYLISVIYNMYISSWHRVLCPSWQSFWYFKVPICKHGKNLKKQKLLTLSSGCAAASVLMLCRRRLCTALCWETY